MPTSRWRPGRRRGFPVVLRPEGAGATGDLAWQEWGTFGRRIGVRCRQADAFVAISREIACELKDAGYDPARIHALPNGVPVPERPWQRRPDWRQAPRAIFVGRLAPEKGLHFLIRGWPGVRQVYPEARLILVGEGPERPALEAEARALGLDGRAGPGRRVSSARWPMSTRPCGVPTCSCFLRLEEGMSMALLEAMALGIPLVASSIPGNRRLVSDFKHGRLAPPEDPALARVIVDQWDNFDRAFHMSRAARSRVLNEFSIAAVARKHLRLFNDVIARQRARA